MKRQLKLRTTAIVVGVLSTLISSSALAQEGSYASTTQEQKIMQALADKTAMLEKELVALRQQITELKKEQQNQHQQIAKATAPATVQTNDTTTVPESANPSYTPASPEAYAEAPLSIHTVDRKGVEDEESRYYPTALMADGKVLTYIAGVPVVTSPYLGARPAFDGSDLIVNLSSINQDIRLMEQRDLIEQHYIDEGYPVPDTPILMLSGTIQPLFTYQKPYNGSTSGDFTLDSAEIDTTAIINPWVEGLMSFVYSSSPPAEGGDVTSNSNVSINKAFVNIGNLDKTPLYMTAGQVYVPFGQYSSNMVSSPMTKTLGRTQVRAAMFGYAPETDNSLFGTVFAYNSDTTGGNSGAGGANLAYQYGNDNINGNIGVSWESNIADSGGMQDTGGSDGQFAGFGSSSATEAISQVPGVDVHGLFNIGAYSFLGEYVSAAQSFEEADLSYNNTGAQPQALAVEGAYTFDFFSKPAAFALGYSSTDEALALQLPKQRFSAVLNVSWWRDTVESLEYRHDIDYSSSDTAGGIGSTVATTGTGKSSDTLSALLAVYF